jgi:hypothetical protein
MAFVSARHRDGLSSMREDQSKLSATPSHEKTLQWWAVFKHSAPRHSRGVNPETPRGQNGTAC